MHSLVCQMHSLVSTTSSQMNKMMLKIAHVDPFLQKTGK